jgi:hypothetical protein
MSPVSPRTASAAAAIAAASRPGGVARRLASKAVEFQTSLSLLLDEVAKRLFREDAVSNAAIATLIRELSGISAYETEGAG